LSYNLTALIRKKFTKNSTPADVNPKPNYVKSGCELTKPAITRSVRFYMVELSFHFSEPPISLSAFLMELNPISTVQTYAQVLGIISIPITGTSSAKGTTGMKNPKLRKR
jgi:hypothetical protein